MPVLLPQLSDDELLATIDRLNTAYRAGTPEVDDDVYDHVYLQALRERHPDHPLLWNVEPEPVGAFGAPHRHVSAMLSTEKAYTSDEVGAWMRRVQSAAAEINIPDADIWVRITAKLDGLAGYWDGAVLATRGDGAFGQDVTRIVSRGVQLDRAVMGPGELVIQQAYFETAIAEQYDMAHARNFMVGLVGADTVKPHHSEALAAGVCRFVPYSTLESREAGLAELPECYAQMAAELCAASEYATDGAVVEVLNVELRKAMGATSHHHRWMLALKTVGEVAQTRVESVTLQVGRTGRITPVLEVAAVELSGATIRRCTAHTARHIERLGLGAGALITLVRSGSVIPKLVSVDERSTAPVDLGTCPCCGAGTVWDNDYLVCPNVEGCSAQASARLEHFFLRLGVKGFGPKLCEQLSQAGALDPIAILEMSVADMGRCGVSAGIAENLLSAIAQRKQEIVRDTDAIAAVGVRHLGRGDSRKILEQHRWQDLAGLDATAIAAIPGFGEHTARMIAPHLPAVCDTLSALVGLGFNIEATVRPSDIAGSNISGKKIVFTGTMPLGRAQMEQQARALGATVQSSVSAATDILVVGDKAGSKKAKAEQLGVQILPLDEYRSLIAGPTGTAPV
ncbi:DNA ligase [Sinimarinibacterium sp. CAU 1509]|uniref:helix-hairpin-helix domain-containing protein n=1 Tax=Sinimarinibacterium sp. CAU 1509 TaxID=2562283 RepID=UPI0010AB5B4C|nr:helix-hairpin-helix domain-containing protein [Sinimarinibacterium sp. CAU 1509]TJY57222.1 DNA ligase [Sinimarinibacterium sp. CAU 1509]